MVEVNVAVTLGLACERVLFGGAGTREPAWQGCLMCVLRWGLPLDFWRKSRTNARFGDFDIFLEEVSRKTLDA